MLHNAEHFDDNFWFLYGRKHHHQLGNKLTGHIRCLDMRGQVAQDVQLDAHLTQLFVVLATEDMS